MEKAKLILDSKRFALTIDRLSYELVENHGDFSHSCIVGIQDGGVILMDKILIALNEKSNISNILNGKLDITFYRDDFRKSSHPIKASSTEMDFLVEGRRVILVDDVLYTGRTILAAMTALLDFGRPASIELLTLIDRRFNRHIPIQADYLGMAIDTMDHSYVKVEWDIKGNSDCVRMLKEKKN